MKKKKARMFLFFFFFTACKIYQTLKSLHSSSKDLLSVF